MPNKYLNRDAIAAVRRAIALSDLTHAILANELGISREHMTKMLSRKVPFAIVYALAIKYVLAMRRIQGVV